MWDNLVASWQWTGGLRYIYIPQLGLGLLHTWFSAAECFWNCLWRPGFDCYRLAGSIHGT